MQKLIKTCSEELFASYKSVTKEDNSKLQNSQETKLSLAIWHSNRCQFLWTMIFSITLTALIQGMLSWCKMNWQKTQSWLQLSMWTQFSRKVKILLLFQSNAFIQELLICQRQLKIVAEIGHQDFLPQLKDPLLLTHTISTISRSTRHLFGQLIALTKENPALKSL